jgi:O-acetyl-ADP-ribose deacetylase (regulator of RNase III)
MKLLNKDILKCTEGLIVHGTNASGAFGSGVAGQIRKQFPQVYDKFKMMPTGVDSLGKLQIVHIENDLYIGNGFTQLNYGNDGKRYASVKAIEQVIHQALNWCSLHDNLSAHFPKIGCGLGGLSWELDVEPIFKEYHAKYPRIEITIYEYNK